MNQHLVPPTRVRWYNQHARPQKMTPSFIDVGFPPADMKPISIIHIKRGSDRPGEGLTVAVPCSLQLLNEKPNHPWFPGKGLFPVVIFIVCLMRQCVAVESLMGPCLLKWNEKCFLPLRKTMTHRGWRQRSQINLSLLTGLLRCFWRNGDREWQRARERKRAREREREREKLPSSPFV